MPYGQSSPVVAGGHVYLTASEGAQRLTICLEAATGRELWRRQITPVRKQDAFHVNDPASPTAAADQDGVVVFFPDVGLAAYTPEGRTGGRSRWARSRISMGWPAPRSSPATWSSCSATSAAAPS